MTHPDPVTLLVTHVDKVLGPGPFVAATGWPHMGAVLCDAVLQAGIGYDAVVKPAVLRLQADWPDADTLTGFRRGSRPTISATFSSFTTGASSPRSPHLPNISPRRVSTRSPTYGLGSATRRTGAHSSTSTVLVRRRSTTSASLSASRA